MATDIHGNSLDFQSDVSPPVATDLLGGGPQISPAQETQVAGPGGGGYTPKRPIPGLENLPGNEGIIGQVLADENNYDPHQVAGILGGLRIESGTGADTTAVNPTSGAAGAPQWLDRAPAFLNFAKQNNFDPADPVAQGKYIAQELRTTEAPTDKALRASTLPEEAAIAYRGFERNGTDNGRVDEQHARQIYNQLSDAIQAKQAQASQPDYQSVLDKLGKNRPQPAPSVNTAPITPNVDPHAASFAGVLQKLHAARSNDPADVANRYPGVQTTPGVLSGIGHFFSWLPQTMFRGLADQSGAPVDALNAAQSYYSANPTQALMAGPGADPGPMGETNQQSQAAQVQPPVIPGGAQDVRTLAGKIGIPTQLPSEVGDTSSAAKWAESLGYAVGSASPFVAANAVNLAKSAIVAGNPLIMPLIKQGAKDLGLTLWAPGMGREIAETVGGQPNKQELIASGVGIGGPVALAGGVKAASALVAAKSLVTAGAQAAEASGNSQLKMMLGKTSIPNQLQTIADNPALAAQNAKSGGVQGPGGPLPEGFNVPAATASMDTPVQALMHYVRTQNAKFNAAYRDMWAGNKDVLGNFSATGMEGGAEDVAQAAGGAEAKLQALQAQRAGDKQTLIRQAKEQADRDFEVATAGANLNPGDMTRLSMDYRENLKGQMLNAWGNANAVTRAEMEVAKNAGLAGTTVPTTRLYDRLNDLMSTAIRSGQGDKFPSKALESLYANPKALEARQAALGAAADSDKLPPLPVGTMNPMKLFDPQGNPYSQIQSASVFKGSAPWEHLQGVYNNIDDQLHSLARKGGDPVTTQYLLHVQDEVLNAMKDLRFGGKFAPGTLPASLQNAINSATENRRLFVDSPVGQLLGMNGRGLPVNNGQDIERWLGNTPETIGKVQSMFDALQPTSVPLGVHPADMMLSHMHDWLRQEFAGAYRNGGIQAAGRFVKNHDVLLSHPGFQDLRQDFQQSIASRNISESLVKGPQDVDPDIEQLQKSRAFAFLNNDPDKALDIALKGPDKFQTTTKLLSELKEDPTGRAIPGVANLAFSRMQGIASVADPHGYPGNTFSGASAVDYYNKNKGMFKAIDRELPGYDERVQQWVRGAQVMDQIKTAPQVPLDRQQLSFTLTGMGRIMARLVGAAGGRAAASAMGLHSTIQYPEIGSQIGAQVFDTLTKDLPAAKAGDVLVKVIMDPQVFSAAMMPLKTAEDAQHVFSLLQPYLLATPDIAVNTAQQLQNQRQQQKEPRK